MKKGILIIMMIVCAITSYCQTKDVAILNNKIKEYVLDEYFGKCETRVDGKEIIITLVIDEAAKESIIEKLKGIYGSGVKQKMIDSLDEMGLNSEPYDNIEFGKDLYGVDNPLFSIQKGWITYLVANNAKFKEFEHVHIYYKDESGATLYNQSINENLKDIAKQLSEMNMTEKGIAMLIAEKLGLDAGVIKNKEMTPYQLDFISTMENIEITDYSYIYFVSIPRYMANMLSVEDYNNMKKDLENMLGNQARSMNFFDKRGADKFGLELVYVYIDSYNAEELIKFVFNPYTLDCKMIPISSEIAEKFSKED